MKPGNLFFQGAKSDGMKSRDEDFANYCALSISTGHFSCKSSSANKKEERYPCPSSFFHLNP